MHRSYGFQHLRHKRPTFAFTGKSGYTLGFRRRIAHSRSHGETRAFPPSATARLVLPAKSPPKEQPEEADARLWRVSASSGVAAPLGCVIFSVSVEIAACMPCAQCFPNVRDEGWYHYPRRALCAVETLGARLAKRLICCFLRSGGRSSPHDSYFLANTQNFLLAVPVANAFALWYDKFSKLEVVYSFGPLFSLACFCLFFSLILKSNSNAI